MESERIMDLAENKSACNKRRITPEILFFIVALLNIGVMWLLLFISNGKAMYIMGYGESSFVDFWAHIHRLLNYDSLYGNLSDADAIFPPLAYCFLSLFARCVRYMSGATNIAITGYGMLVFSMYLLIFMTVFIQVLNYNYKTDKKVVRIIMPFIFLFSYPFWGCAFERGNPVIYAMLFLYIGLALRNHPNKVLREISLICVAISAGFKIYPALFGLLWLAEKRYWEAFRLVIYGIIAFFLPFIFFGGMQGIVDYVGTFMRYVGKDIYSQTSILGNCILIFGEHGKQIGRIVVLIWMTWVVYYTFSEGITWKTITLLTSTQTIIIAESYVYTYVFIVIPCMFFLNYVNEKRETKIMNYVYAILFAFVFTIPPLINIQSGVLVGIYVSWIAILLLVSIEKVIKVVVKR